MAGKRYKHPDTLQDRRKSRVTPPLELIAPGTDLLGDDLRPVPRPPTGLTAKAREFWRELHTGPMAKVIIRTDGFPLHRYIWTVDQWLVATADLAALRKEVAPRGATRSRQMPTMLEQLEELQEAQARGLIDDEEVAATRRVILDLWANATGGRPPVVSFYDLGWRIQQALRHYESELKWLEQHYGLTPLARMRLNIEAVDAISGLEELNRMLDGGPVDARAEPEWVDE